MGWIDWLAEAHVYIHNLLRVSKRIQSNGMSRNWTQVDELDLTRCQWTSQAINKSQRNKSLNVHGWQRAWTPDPLHQGSVTYSLDHFVLESGLKIIGLTKLFWCQIVSFLVVIPNNSRTIKMTQVTNFPVPNYQHCHKQEHEEGHAQPTSNDVP